MISPNKIKGSWNGRPLVVRQMATSEFEDLQVRTLRGNAPYDWFWVGYVPQSGGGGGKPHSVYIYVTEEPEKVELPDIDTITLAARINNKGEW